MKNLFKCNNKDNGVRLCHSNKMLSQPAFTCSNSTMETPELQVKSVQKQQQRYSSFSGVFIVNFDQISHILLVFPLLTLNK